LRGDKLVFGERVDGTAARDAFRAIAIARKKGKTGLTLDFASAQRAYPEGMIQIIALTDQLRREEIHFDVILPTDRHLVRVFEAGNWAHFISPLIHEPTASSLEWHLPLRRYHTGQEQRAVVDDSIELLLHQIKVERDVLHALEWSLNEITDNVLVHAEAPAGGLVQVTTFREQRRVQMVVSDGGRGILASMQENLPDLTRDTDAIGEAMKQGVTRSTDIGQGNGLAGALRIATGSSGSLTILSGQGEVKVIRPPGAAEHEHKTYRRRGDEGFEGTMVFVEVMVDELVDLDEALDFGGGGAVDWDYIDATYGDDYSDVILRVADEAVGFGTRAAGESFRIKLDNLARAKPSSTIVLDWTGVPLVSSSFADEVLGKLFVEMGPLTFGSRVRSTGMEPLVRKITDRSIMQRAAQSGRST
jgi:anti-sigma regulatory factor (Ser/Thr protein kinase)